ncbi:hypothetical protein ABZ402_46070 [Streptomyces mirabilis]|uniref:hypothetical protein n=1 Tax=Streptomyces mirabilis TaxID=68239 RepID=UPI0033CDDF9B
MARPRWRPHPRGRPSARATAQLRGQQVLGGALTGPVRGLFSSGDRDRPVGTPAVLAATLLGDVRPP